VSTAEQLHLFPNIGPAQPALFKNGEIHDNEKISATLCHRPNGERTSTGMGEVDRIRDVRLVAALRLPALCFGSELDSGHR